MEKHNTGIFIPNEIFSDLQNNLLDSRQLSFAYSYYTYTHYLFRHCKHVDESGEFVTQSKIKERLGYSPINKAVNSLIKKDGLLDRLGYTFTSTNYPLSWYLDKDNDVRFVCIKDIENLPATLNEIKRFRIKVPVKGFHRNSTNELDGTFYNTEDTHLIEIEKMDEIIKKIGVVGFYLFGYLSCKTAIYKDGYQISLDKLSEETKVSLRPLKKTLKKLKDESFILTINEKYESGRNVDFLPNIYQLS